MGIGNKIKMLREENNMTLEELGEKVGVGKSTVRKWENGIIENMRRDKIEKLAKVFGVSPAYLLGYEDKFTGENAIVVRKIMQDDKLMQTVKCLIELDDVHREKIYSDIEYWHEVDI